VVSQLPSSLSEVTAESDSLYRLMSGIKQLHVTGYLKSVDTRRLAADLLQFVFQVRHLTLDFTSQRPLKVVSHCDEI